MYTMDMVVELNHVWPTSGGREGEGVREVLMSGPVVKVAYAEKNCHKIGY